MKTIVVTPAGRRRYMEVLFKNLLREKKDIDFWEIWINTNVQSDIQYLNDLARDNKWIKLVHVPEINEVSSWNIHKFFKHAMDKDSVYVRLDDDIVYLEKGFFSKLVSYRIKNKNPFLVYANIINNAVISHIHQRNGLLNLDMISGYICNDPIGWENPEFAEKVHRSFIKDVRLGNENLWHSSFHRWVCYGYERVSINAISWMGSDMADIDGQIHPDEEEFLSVCLPMELGRPNEIFGGAIAAHFAFYTQRQHMDSTNILEAYEKLSS